MCCNGKKPRCCKQENLKTKLEECSQVQIRACHGNVKSHPYVPKRKKERR